MMLKLYALVECETSVPYVALAVEPFVLCELIKPVRNLRFIVSIIL